MDLILQVLQFAANNPWIFPVGGVALSAFGYLFLTGVNMFLAWQRIAPVRRRSAEILNAIDAWSEEKGYGYKGSDLEQVIELTSEVLTKGKVTPADAKRARDIRFLRESRQFILGLYNPVVARSKEGNHSDDARRVADMVHQYWLESKSAVPSTIPVQVRQ